MTLSLQHYARQRIEAEYNDMPGTRLTLQQAQRLCGTESSVCRAVLQTLVGSHFLRVTADGSYVRCTEGPHPGPAAGETPASKRPR